MVYAFIVELRLQMQHRLNGEKLSQENPVEPNETSHKTLTGEWTIDDIWWIKPFPKADCFKVIGTLFKSFIKLISKLRWKGECDYVVFQQRLDATLTAQKFTNAA